MINATINFGDNNLVFHSFKRVKVRQIYLYMVKQFGPCLKTEDGEWVFEEARVSLRGHVKRQGGYRSL